MAGRYLLKMIAPTLQIHELIISESGKPLDSNGNCHFSISHDHDLVAVAIHDEYAVGIDIQKPVNKLETIQHKFISDADRLVLSNLNLPALAVICLAWSLKETLFKWYGAGKVNFIEDLHILSVEQKEEGYTFNCQILKEKKLFVSVRSIMIDNAYLTFTL